MSIPTKEDRITLRIAEGKHGWVYAVHTGDGSEEGSLKAAGLVGGTVEQAMDAGHDALMKWTAIRDCDHEWAPWEPVSTVSDVPQCTKCGIVNWVEDPQVMVHVPPTPGGVCESVGCGGGGFILEPTKRLMGLDSPDLGQPLG